jgi:hypothetical protein
MKQRTIYFVQDQKTLEYLNYSDGRKLEPFEHATIYDTFEKAQTAILHVKIDGERLLNYSEKFMSSLKDTAARESWSEWYERNIDFAINNIELAKRLVIRVMTIQEPI